MTVNLTELIPDEVGSGPWRLYIYRYDGFHAGGQWFARKIKYPGEEIHAESAKILADAAVRNGREVMVTNGSDNMVFHAVEGKVVYPPHGDAERFWKEVMECK